MITRSIAHSLGSVYRRLSLMRMGTGERWHSMDIGRYMRVDPSDFMDQAMLFGYYEADLVYWLRNTIGTGDIAVDVGAHKGYITLLLSTLVGPTGKVVSFEPDPYAFETLRANIDYNGLDTVTLYPYVASNQSGHCEFYVSNQRGFSSRFPNETATPLIASTISAEMQRLDSIVQDKYDISFVKIDAEGSELHVLEGMKDILSSSHPSIWLEINRPSFSAANVDPESVRDMLRSFGYFLYRASWQRDMYQRGFLSLQKIDSFLLQPACFNILALPDSFEQLENTRGMRVQVMN